MEGPAVMPRIRSVHPEICDDEDLALLSANGERTYVRLWTHLDDEGRAEDRPKLLASRLYPEHDDMGPEEVDRDLNELCGAGFIMRYEANGKRYLSAKPTAWKKFQKPRHPTASKLPAPPEDYEWPTDSDGSSTAERRNPPAGVVGVDGEGEGVGEGVAPPKASRSDPIFEAVTRACGINRDELTPSARGALNKALKDLRGVDATPTEIFQRAGNWRTTYPDSTLTPSALAKHWPQLARAQPPQTKDRFAEMARSLAARGEDSNGSIDTTARSHGRVLPEGQRS